MVIRDLKREEKKFIFIEERVLIVGFVDSAAFFVRL